MSDDPVSVLLMIVFNVSVGSIPIILVVIVLKALFREYGATVVNASRKTVRSLKRYLAI